jgi:hypothetical protein
VAQKLFQNIFVGTINHSQFADPNRSRLIETQTNAFTPPPSDSGKKGVRAFFKTPMFSSPDSIPHDTKSGKISALAPTAADASTAKSPTKTHHSSQSEIRTRQSSIDFSLFQKWQPPGFSKSSSFPAPNQKTTRQTNRKHRPSSAHLNPEPRTHLT